MKTYGLENKHIKFIRNSITKVFGPKNIPLTYLFGSRSTGKQKKFSDIELAIKDGDNIDQNIDTLQDLFEESDLPYKVDLVNWDKLLDEYKPSVEKQKRLFWSQGQKERSTPWRACPIGEHWVRRHNKKTRSGKIGDWDGHCRANPGKKDLLKSDEMTLIAESSAFKRAFPKVSKESLDFPKGNDFNHLITGWTAYWNYIFKPKIKLHPNYVKALIASESSFKAETKAPNRLKVGEAQGLVQLTEQTQKILKDRKGELRDQYIYLKKNDIWDANKNIAAAIRWLFRKRETARARLGKEPSWEQVIHEYKGILKQNNKTANGIKRKYKKFLKALNAKD